MNILVTGASRGIGKNIAENLSGNIFVIGRNKSTIECYPNYLVCDLSDDLTQLGEYILENHIDVVINNAGEYIYKNTQDLTYYEMHKITKTNLIAPLFIISKALPYMKTKKWGRIINIGSISGVMGESGASIYSATKSGLIGMTKSIALEVAQDNITINTINPGWVETELGENSISDSEFSTNEIIDSIPQKRFVMPEEITHMIKYLISNEAKGVTGQSINLCAGLSVGY